MKAKLMFLALVLLAIYAMAQYTPPHTNPGPAVDKIIGKSVRIDQAGAAIKAGDIDAYIFGIRSALAAGLKGDPAIVIHTAAAGFNDIVLNPAPADPPCLNPFSNKAIRQAMQYIVDRDYISGEIFKGFSIPMYMWLSTHDPTYSIVADLVARLNIRYDPDYAKSIVEREMPKLGATKGPDGKWYCGDKPVTVIGLIRIEDERKDIGDAFASALEKLGITVDRKYVPFGPAIQTVYGTNPAEFQWHFYTEGWGKGALDRWDTSSIAQYCASWFGYMPGWGETGWYNYENKTIDEITDVLYKGNFKSFQEYVKLYREGTFMCLQESIRVFVNARLDVHLTTPALRGVTSDLGAGLRAVAFNMRNWYVPGRDVVYVGHLYVWTESSAWNPVPRGGFTDVYSVDWWRAIYDPTTWRHPFTGKPIPFRVTYAVETRGPDDAFVLPPDAYRWDARQKAWVSAGGEKAKSKVIVNLAKFVGAKWHHGQTFTLADVIYATAFTWDIANDPAKVEREPGVASYVNASMSLVKGIRVLNSTAIEVYVDYWHFDPDFIAEFGVIGASMPWEVIYAVDQLVYERKTHAASRAGATRHKVPWLSLILRDHAKAAVDVLRAAQDAGYYPESWFKIGDRTYLTREEALARYRAAIQWFETYGHLIISNGPFYLYAIDPEIQYIELRAFRDPTYPFKPGDFYFGTAIPVSIASIQVADVAVGQTATATISLEAPKDAGKIFYRWAVVDPTTGDFLYTSEESATETPKITLTMPSEVTKTLAPNRVYKLWILTYSENVPIVSIATETFRTVMPAPTPTPTPTPTPAPTPTPGVDVGTIAAIIALVVILAILAIVLRRRKS